MLTKKSATAATSARRLRGAAARQLGQTMDRRAFLKRSGLGVGAGALATQLPYNFIGAADAAAPAGVSRAEGKAEIRRTVCTHCSVGCAIDAVVQQRRVGASGAGVRLADQPRAHCAKGASLREHGHGEYRLKYPMKLVDGKYQKISWDRRSDEVGDRLLKIREESGPDAVYWIGSSKHNNEQAYLLRKFVSMWGTNNCDHQARICHSTTVAGVANTWGYGAMTNSYNDMQNAKAMLFIGSNAAEAHPVSLLHILHAKENGAKMIVVDPRFTRTAAKAHQYIRIRSGTDVPFLFGLLYHIFQNGWEDKQYIDDRVFGMDKIREEVLAKWTPDKVEEACGVPAEQMLLAARTMAENRPSTIVWCMGQTQHSIGNAMVRASCILQLALGNIGKSGGGPTSSAATTTCRARPTSAPTPTRCPATTASPPARGSTGRACGAWTTSGSRVATSRRS
jgi:formate dehydrogenase major subunit